MRKGRRSERGFAMLEVLVSIVILAFGIMGLAGLQGRALNAEFEANQRTQALILLQDMYNRMLANKANAASYLTTSGKYIGDSATQTLTCSGTLTRAQSDLCEWSTLLGSLTGGRACIAQVNTTPTYMITVAWQGLSPTSIPPSSVTCASGTYAASNDAFRRALTLTLQ